MRNHHLLVHCRLEEPTDLGIPRVFRKSEPREVSSLTISIRVAECDPESEACQTFITYAVASKATCSRSQAVMGSRVRTSGADKTGQARASEYDAAAANCAASRCDGDIDGGRNPYTNDQTGILQPSPRTRQTSLGIRIAAITSLATRSYSVDALIPRV
jgi:hypothetical protein